jgi:hypothetical protein
MPAVKETVAEDIFHDAHSSEDENTQIIHNISSKEYKQYKIKLFGNFEPHRTDPHCKFYYISNNQIKKFVNIKKYGMNLKIDENHVERLKIDIKETTIPQIFGHIAVIEYTNYETNDPEDLIEVIDGHHRISALKQIFDNNCKFEISMWVCLHTSDNPESIKTKEIFKKYNVVKPFKIDFNKLEISDKIIKGLNNRFNKTGNKFELIKDADRVAKPSIKQHTFNQYIQSRLDYLIETKNICSNDINIDVIINNFIKKNKEFVAKDIDWFNKDKKYGSKSKITDNMYTKAVSNHCYIGLVDLEILIAECVNI